MIFNKEVPKKNGYFWVIIPTDKYPNIAYVNIEKDNDVGGGPYVRFLCFHSLYFSLEECLYGDEIEIPKHIFLDN